MGYAPEWGRITAAGDRESRNETLVGPLHGGDWLLRTEGGFHLFPSPSSSLPAIIRGKAGQPKTGRELPDCHRLRNPHHTGCAMYQPGKRAP